MLVKKFFSLWFHQDVWWAMQPEQPWTWCSRFYQYASFPEVLNSPIHCTVQNLLCELLTCRQHFFWSHNDKIYRENITCTAHDLTQKNFGNINHNLKSACGCPVSFDVFIIMWQNWKSVPHLEDAFLNSFFVVLHNSLTSFFSYCWCTSCSRTIEIYFFL